MSALRYITFEHLIRKLYAGYEERFDLTDKRLLRINSLKLIFFWKVLFNFPTYCPDIGEKPPRIKTDAWKMDFERLKDYWIQGRYHPYTRLLRPEEILVMDMLKILEFHLDCPEDDEYLLPEKDLWDCVRQNFPDMNWPKYRIKDIDLWYDFLENFIDFY